MSLESASFSPNKRAKRKTYWAPYLPFKFQPVSHSRSGILIIALQLYSNISKYRRARSRPSNFLTLIQSHDEVISGYFPSLGEPGLQFFHILVEMQQSSNIGRTRLHVQRRPTGPRPKRPKVPGAAASSRILYHSQSAANATDINQQNHQNHQNHPRPLPQRPTHLSSWFQPIQSTGSARNRGEVHNIPFSSRTSKLEHVHELAHGKQHQLEYYYCSQVLIIVLRSNQRYLWCARWNCLGCSRLEKLHGGSQTS